MGSLPVWNVSHPMLRFRPAPIAWALTVLAVVSVTLSACRPPARRTLRIQVELEGKPLLRAVVHDDTGAPGAKLWADLERWALIPTSGDSSLLVGTAVTLTGSIELRLEHSGATIAKATLSTLDIRRTTTGRGTWKLAPGEAARTAKIAGL